jgi:hypothetical protein
VTELVDVSARWTLKPPKVYAHPEPDETTALRESKPYMVVEVRAVIASSTLATSKLRPSVMVGTSGNFSITE